MVAIIATAIVSIVVSIGVSAALIIKITAESQKTVADFMLKEFEENSKLLVQSHQSMDEMLKAFKGKIE